MPVAGSALPGIDAGRVRRWLAGHIDGLAGAVEFGLVWGGRSNLTYRLTDAAGAAYAVRRPPTGGVLSTAHDVSGEWRFISALAPAAVPVPRWVSPDCSGAQRWQGDTGQARNQGFLHLASTSAAYDYHLCRLPVNERTGSAGHRGLCRPGQRRGLRAGCTR